MRANQITATTSDLKMGVIIYNNVASRFLKNANGGSCKTGANGQQVVNSI